MKKSSKVKKDQEGLIELPSLENPFTPTFGEIPVCLAGRDAIIEDFDIAFSREGRSPDLTTLLSGPRGSGKTALLGYLAERAEAAGWVPVRVTAMEGVLDEILDQALVKSSHLVDKDAGGHLTGVGVASILSLEWERPEGRRHTWRTEMAALIEQLNKKGIGLLILVDEVRGDLEEMVRLVATYQLYVGERRRVGLIMAGIPYQISSLLGNASSTFLRRAQQRKLGKIDDYAVKDALYKTIAVSGRDVEEEALSIAAAGIEGFAYMLQLVGFRMWNAHPAADVVSAADARLGVARAKDEMRDRVLESTWMELSDGDIAFLTAMLPDERESRIRDIAERMGKPGSYVSTYRRRLLKQGIIGERRRGVVGFDLPAFREFLEEKLQ